MQPEAIEAAVKKVLDGFDFTKVHDYMEQTDWRWGRGHGAVPSIEEMTAMARSMLMQVAVDAVDNDKPVYAIHSGGFIAQRWHHVIYLYFSISDLSAPIQ